MRDSHFDARSSMQQYTTGQRNTSTYDNNGDSRATRPTTHANSDMNGSRATTGGNTSAGQQRVVHFDCSDGQPLQLISADPRTGEFNLISETYDVI